ncbi:MAG: type IV secretion system DNA-binding domain-containing protein [Patescibacteria group bacterium]|nr:type IV secretion system DNA-binding domain-containing protein [Patescibacteria group bacterium]
MESIEISLSPTDIQFFQSIWFFIILFVVIAGIIIFIILRQRLKKSVSINFAFQNVSLLITLPKESKEDENKKPTIKEYLMPMENFFDNIGGLKAQRGWKSGFVGRTDSFSFEIVSDKEGTISFYIVVPKYLQQFFEQQLHAQYPMAEIDQVEDYNIFAPKNVIAGVNLKLKKHYIFPIKTYTKSEVDPLNAITNALSKIAEGDAAAIQIVACSAKSEWHRLGANVASAMQQGKKLKEAMSSITGGGLSGFFKGFGEAAFPQPSKPDAKGEPKKPYQLSPMEQEIIKTLEEKAGRAGMDVNIRIVVSAQDKIKAEAYLNNIVNAFSQYNAYEYGNSFTVVKVSPAVVAKQFIYRLFNEKYKFVLNTEEITSIFHLPLPITETPNIHWLIARKAPAPVDLPTEGIILGKNIYRGEEKLIRIKTDDRRRHLYIIGKSGTGKSVLISNMAIQDIKNGNGVCVIDPHGDLVNSILENIPKERMDDVIYFDPSDTERPIGLNMLEARSMDQRDFAVQEMIAIFYKLFPPEMIGPMFEHNMRNVMLTLMNDIKNPGTIAEIPRMFSDAEFQALWVSKLTDPVVRSFWEKEMAKTSDFHKSEMLGYLISKVGRFVENEMMRNVIGQTHSGFDVRDIMDNQKILLVNLSKGKVGEVNANLLGLIIVSKLQMAAMGRAELPESERKDFYLYVDEFQNFITDSITTILSEARKYRLCLTIAHQYIGQLSKGADTSIRDAVLGTVGTLVAFKMGVEDTEILAKEFAPVFSSYDLINVEKFNAYIKLLVNNQSARPFNMITIPPQKGDSEISKIIKEVSRLKYGKPRAEVNKEIMERSRLGSVPLNQEAEIERTL